STYTVANHRTLEQKISDAGPGDQRCDPHIITTARDRLEQQGVIAFKMEADAPWYYASNSPPKDVARRMDELVAVYDPYRKLHNSIGRALEIATYRALCAFPGADFFGHFPNLD